MKPRAPNSPPEHPVMEQPVRYERRMHVSVPCLPRQSRPHKHVRMHLEADLGRAAGALDQLGQDERCTPLGNESEGRLGHAL